MAAIEELLALIDREIPEGRKSLQENYINLENIAKHCEDNYFKASKAQKSHALQETQNFTTHSLASVAYQINSLATNFLKLLDLQQNQLTDMESSVNHLNQMVMIHKEKVARREIGILTVGKNVPKPIGMKNGVIYPGQAERPIKYVRKSVDYTELDGVGHGLGHQAASLPPVARSLSISSTSSSNVSNRASAAKLPAGPVYQLASGEGGTVSRASGAHYRTPVAPVTVPSTPLLHGPLSPGLPPPPGDSHDFPDHLTASSSLPPPPPDDQSSDYNYMGVSSRPQVFDGTRDGLTLTRDGSLIRHSQTDSYVSSHSHEDPYAATGPELLSQSSMIPQNYLEKVVAIYDYEACKPDELTFAENAVIYVIHKNEDGWWEGTSGDGQTGLFPYNYVEPCM